MNLQQGVGSLADSFISRSGNATGTIYTVPTADQNSQPPILPTTALVKSIKLSNQSGGAITTTVTMMDSSNSRILQKTLIYELEKIFEKDSVSFQAKSIIDSLIHDRLFQLQKNMISI